uniref:Protein croquemort-like n=1 Tax=Hirondellea gigas TaxID=1518452 RepID=A0A2P2HXR1_9CRUS
MSVHDKKTLLKADNEIGITNPSNISHTPSEVLHKKIATDSSDPAKKYNPTTSSSFSPTSSESDSKRNDEIVPSFPEPKEYYSSKKDPGLDIKTGIYVQLAVMKDSNGKESDKKEDLGGNTDSPSTATTIFHSLEQNLSQSSTTSVNSDLENTKQANDGVRPKTLSNGTDSNAFSTIKKSRKMSCCFIATVIFGFVSLIVGTVMLAGGYDALFNSILKSQLSIYPGSRAYDIWRLTPVPLSCAFFLYNLTNPDEFKKGSKPMLAEVGPYVYREYHEKVGIEFHGNNTVRFFQKRWWVWDQEASGSHRQEDLVIILNTVPVSAAYSASQYGDILSNIALMGMNVMFRKVGEELTLEATVKDVLFDGYEDPLLDFVQEHPNLTDILNLPPGLTDYDKMAWFYKRNESESYDGEFNMFTGEDTLDNLGNLDWWNRTHDTEFFDPPCNSIFGSAGEIWPPNQQKTAISFYCTDLCMTLTLQYKEPVTDQFGLEGYRYWADNRTFASPDEVPENLCYCFTNETCPVAGLLDAQTCRMGSPALISFPHFLHGDPKLLEDVEGVTPPEEENHQMIIDMIPELGVPLSVRARIQINMAVVPYKGIAGLDILRRVKEVVLPLLWFEVSADLTQELADEIKPVVFLIRSPTMTIIWVLMMVAGAAVLITLLVVVALQRQKQQRAVARVRTREYHTFN